MGYESAWLNGKISCAVAGLKGIDTVYMINEHADEKNGAVFETAAIEVVRASFEMFGHKAITKNVSNLSEVYTNSVDNANIVLYLSNSADEPVKGSYSIVADALKKVIIIKAFDASGILYGAFRLMFRLRLVECFEKLSFCETPASPLRMLNHWDNLDGSIERGYSGRSFFFDNNVMLVNDRIDAYARMIASVGINGCVINNVNVKEEATKLITSKYRKEIKAYADSFKRYGIGFWLCLNFASPIELGGLDTCDPCDEKVVAWWKQTLDELMHDVPELKGFLIKADSEGRPGPFTYGRTHAEGANMLADIIAPYGGTIIWRCFVYNCKQDWRDTVTDRAKAQFDNFMPLDGQFRDNVILQIKNGPMDFQPREPVSTLFSGLKNTNEMIEFQIAQEYTGQQIHVCYLIPEFKEILEFKTYITDNAGTPLKNDTVRDVVTGKTFGNKACGMAAVTNTGNDSNWTGHDLAAANLYGFGRLSFNPELSSDEIAEEWIGLTFGRNKKLSDKISYILNTSWPAYEKYTSPLGVGWMVNPSHHYGPNVDGYEFSEWGTYHRSDELGMGVNRGSSGTDYIHQYNEPVASMYENLETCPDELLLFMHHVPYTYRLHSGKTVIQHIYDTHYEGAELAESMQRAWEELEGEVEPEVFNRTLERFKKQTLNACEWRDHIVGYYRKKSGIADERGRV